MEENKNNEIEQTQNNEEINIEEQTSAAQEEVEEIDSEFVDIDKDTMKKNYIIIGILYLVVIILSILLVIGIKNQKDTVKDKINNDKEINNKVEEDQKEEFVPNESPKEEQKEENIVPDTNNNKENDKLNILDQI